MFYFIRNLASRQPVFACRVHSLSLAASQSPATDLYFISFVWLSILFRIHQHKNLTQCSLRHLGQITVTEPKKRKFRLMSGGRGVPPPRIEGMTSLKVDNLSSRTGPADLRKAFEKFGEIGDIHIPRDRWTRDSRGFAFVRFHSRRDAERAMGKMDGRRLDGRQIHIVMARYGRPIDDRGRNGDDYYRRRRSVFRSFIFVHF
ncbi:hypothetical protein M514_05766 [Trichuris suis]|uniref:RRM domain-containing protein n=1 Tax=Trichuris suis TaxID=68888 RepID=A0A085NA72_9BILA|nr:hypothetical protein M514_05766 [Trichuris suis]